MKTYRVYVAVEVQAENIRDVFDKIEDVMFQARAAAWFYVSPAQDPILPLWHGVPIEIGEEK